MIFPHTLTHFHFFAMQAGHISSRPVKKFITTVLGSQFDLILKVPVISSLIYNFTQPLISMQFYYWSQLDKFTRFETRVESAVWNAVAKDWTLSLRNEKSGEKSIEKFTFLVSCVGGLHVPNIPGRVLSNYENAYSIQYLK